MMFYTSKLIQEATEQQDRALNQALKFSDPLQQAMALADYFEKIQAEEYIIPELSLFEKMNEKQSLGLHEYCNL
jgi:hypothetical protein